VVAAAEQKAALRGDPPVAPTPTATPTPRPKRTTARPKRSERGARTRARAARGSSARRSARAGATPAPEPTATPTATPAAAAETPTPAPARTVRLLRGKLRGADGHAGTGTATVVRKAQCGRRLTFTDFDADGGIDVRVYLVAGDGSDVEDHVELGRLKGERGDQQYTVPPSVDLSRYGTVVLWCVPASVRIAVAPLR